MKIFYNSSYTVKLSNILLIVWTLVFLNLRPGVIGEVATPPLLFLILFVSVAYRVMTQPRFNLRIDKNELYVKGSWLIVTAYLLLQGLLLSDAKSVVLKNTMVSVIVFVSIVLVVNRTNYTQILKTFVWFNVLLAISCCITAVFLFVNLFDIYSLPVIAKFGTYGGFSDGSQLLHHRVLFFPYTLCWSGTHIMGFTFPRFIGIYKEPGVAQIFFTTAYFLTYYIDFGRNRLFRFFLLGATFLTFSTAGLISLFLGHLILERSKIKPIQFLKSLVLNPVKGLFFVLLIIMSTQIVFANLAEEFSGVSGISRLKSYIRGLELLANKPIFGYGYCYGFEVDESGRATSETTNGLLGVSFQLGIIGLVLYSISCLFGIFTYGNKYTLPIYIPYFFTIATSQPSFNVPLTVLLVLLPLQNLNKLKP